MIMARNPRDHKTPSTKQEPCFQEDGKNAPAAATAAAAGAARSARAASSRAWPGLKDPRIVRVSRAFGGKDRHSKVSTVRGLRDRRVRLSVQTAIQLYDLQERLGLSQPSKVVDWLLDAAGHEIDQLPPLQIPPGMSCFLQFPPPPAAMASHLAVPPSPQLASAVAAASDVNPMEEGSTGSGSTLALGNYDRGSGHVEHQEPPLSCNQHHAAEVIPVDHGNLHRLGFLSMLNGGGGGGNSNYGSFCFLETPGVYAQQTHGQLGGCYSMTTSQAAEETHGYRPVPAPPPTPLLSLSHASQLLLCPSGAAAPSMFSPYAAASHGDSSSNSTVFQLLGSSASSQSSKHHQFWNGQESG